MKAPKIGKWLRNTKAGKSLLTLSTVVAVASVGVLGTSAAFSDQVTMAQIDVTGGSLDLEANNGNGPNQAWVGALSANITGMAPGDTASGTVNIENAGDLPFTLTVDTAGADASTCFSYYFRETSVVAGTGSAGPFPLNFTGMGTATTPDASTAAFATAITARQLPDSGADLNWETDDEKQYTLTVRMLTSCTANAANGTLDFTFDADQV